MLVSELQTESHRIAQEHGWWAFDRSVPELLALVHSEVSEALEEWRDSRGLTHLHYIDGKPEGFEVELADILIRVADMAEAYRLDLTTALEAKMAYNETRPYRHGGKRA